MIGYDVATLRSSWKHVRSKGGAAGGDGLGCLAFAVGLDRRLSNLAAAVAAGSYRPGPLRQVSLPKAGGGTRILKIPTLADRIVQTACARQLAPLLDTQMSGQSFGYRPARSVDMALDSLRAAARGMTHALDADIRRFFDEVPHDRLLDDLAFWIGDVVSLRLIALWLASFGPGVGLAQGAPISPLLANVALHPLDMALVREGFAHIRYADDFVVLAPSLRRAQSARDLSAAVLHRRGLALHPDKTAILSLDRPLHFLGQSLSLKEPAQVRRGVAKNRKA